MPFPIIALAIGVISFVAQSLLRPKQKPPKAANISDFNVTAEEAVSIPYLAGTRKLAPNITFFGDLQARPITKTISRIWLGFLVPDIKNQQVIGYRYNVGMEHGLCFGPGVTLKRMTMDDKELFSGSLIGSPGTTTILKENLFGGEDNDGEGGVNVILDFYEGTSSQTANSYMVSQYARQSGHRDVSYAVWRGPSQGAIYVGGKYVSGCGYLGKNPIVRPIAYYLQRLPNFLGDAYKSVGANGDANPANIIYELAISKLFGGGLPTSKLDTPAFQAAAQTLFNEGIGISPIWDRTDSMENLLQQIVNIADAALYSDPLTGLITFKLIRNDYDPNTLLELTDDDVLEIEDYTRGAWDDTKNEVRLTYTSRADDYKAKIALGQDLANQRIRNATDPLALQYDYVLEPDLAQKLAFRETRVAATPLARATIRCNRKAAVLGPGSVFKWTTNRIVPGLSSKIMRVAKANYGRLGDSRVTLEITEDIYSLGGTIYSPPATSAYNDPVGTPQASPNIVAQEAPYWYAKEKFLPWSFVQQPSGSHVSYDVYASTDGGTVYNLTDSSQFFTPVGALASSYPQVSVGAYDATGFEVTNVAGLVDVFANDPAYANQGSNLLYFEDTGEICAFETVTFSNITGRYTFAGIWRGVLDTTPAAHGSSTRVWVFTLGQSVSSVEYPALSTVKLKHLPRNGNGQIDLSAATAKTIAADDRALKPYPPGDFQVDGSYTSNTHTGDVALSWVERNRVTQATILKQSDSTVTPEAGTTYKLVIKNASNTVIRTETGLSGTTYNYTQTTEMADNSGVLSISLTFELQAECGGRLSNVWRRTSTRV
jgi:hypothetical protein